MRTNGAATLLWTSALAALAALFAAASLARPERMQMLALQARDAPGLLANLFSADRFGLSPLGQAVAAFAILYGAFAWGALAVLSRRWPARCYHELTLRLGFASAFAALAPEAAVRATAGYGAPLMVSCAAFAAGAGLAWALGRGLSAGWHRLTSPDEHPGLSSRDGAAFAAASLLIVSFALFAAPVAESARARRELQADEHRSRAVRRLVERPEYASIVDFSDGKSAFSFHLALAAHASGLSSQRRIVFFSELGPVAMGEPKSGNLPEGTRVAVHFNSDALEFWKELEYFTGRSEWKRFPSSRGPLVFSRGFAELETDTEGPGPVAGECADLRDGECLERAIRSFLLGQTAPVAILAASFDEDIRRRDSRVDSLRCRALQKKLYETLAVRKSLTIEEIATVEGPCHLAAVVNPHDFRLHQELADILVNVDDVESALLVAGRFKRGAKNNWLGDLLLARLLARSANVDRRREAQRYYRAVIARFPWAAAFYTELARSLAGAGLKSEAESALMEGYSRTGDETVLSMLRELQAQK
ncbi:MAG TPA: hypothetical protein VFV50_16295 [Bdellovibrionales bacterium]|nr:hypothetical protein [Bdellovibrionales bacterium]